MSSETIVFTDYSARLKNFGIEITAQGRDDLEAVVFIDSDDLHEFYSMTARQFQESYGEDAKVLAEVFGAIQGIKIIEPN